MYTAASGMNAQQANIDNIAEAAACSRSRTTTLESTRQPSFTKSESRPPAGGSQPKPTSVSDACRTTGINCGTDDDDDDDRPARKPRGSERSYLPSSIQLEKENTAPTHQRSTVMGHGTDRALAGWPAASDLVEKPRGHYFDDSSRGRS